MQDRANVTYNLTNWQFILMMLCCVIFWALAFPFIKIALDELSYINLTIMRFFIVCIILLPVLIFRGRWFSKLHKKDVFPIFILGFFGVMVYHLGLNYGEQYISPSVASLFIATIPIFIVILAAIFLKERISLKKLLGIILALCGVVVISIWGTTQPLDLRWRFEITSEGYQSVVTDSVIALRQLLSGPKVS